MPIHRLKLLDRQEVAKNTFVFVFEKPANFPFKPGQYGGFTHKNSALDAANINRRFSLLSTPQDETITIATRMQPSAYKQQLMNMAIGSEITFAGPTGNFVLHEDANVPAVFIAGGIGITPFYSIIRDAVQRKGSHAMTLFYGNQTLEDTAFYQELTQLQQEHPLFQCIVSLANPAEGWQGETGFIDDTVIKKYVADLTTPIFYICGSPAMVNALRGVLNDLEIPAEHIRVEDFPGY